MTNAVETLHARHYRETGPYQQERADIFGKSWILIGHESQLKKPGDYLAVSAAEYPLIAVKGYEDEKKPVWQSFSAGCGRRLA